MRMDRLDKTLQRNVNLKIDDLKARAFNHHRDKVFTDIVHVTLNGANHRGAEACCCVFGKMRLQHFNAFFHRTRRDQHLRHERLAAAETLADDTHCVHHALIQDLHRIIAFVDGGLHQFCDNFRFSGFNRGKYFFNLAHSNLIHRRCQFFFCPMRPSRNAVM